MVSPTPRGSAHPQALVGAALLALVAYGLVGAATLTALPIVWMDEPWYTQSAWDFVQHGTFTLPMFADLAGFDVENVLYGRIYLAAMALAFEVLGVDPFAARLVSLVAASIALILVFLVGRELWSARVGALAAVLLGVAPAFVSQSHDARPELMLIATWLLAFFTVLRAERSRPSVLLAIGGFVAAMGLEVHMNAILVPAALLIVLMVRRTPVRGIIAFLLGAGSGVALWMVVHVAPDLTRFVSQVAHFSRPLPLGEVVRDPVGLIAWELRRFTGVWTGDGAATVLLTAAAVIIVLVRGRDRSAWTVMALGATLIVGMTVGIASKTPVYAVLLWPVAALLVARALDLLPRRAAIGIAAGLIGLALLANVHQAVRLSPADYDGYMSRIRAAIPPAATVQGQPTLWFGLGERDLIADHYLFYADSYAAAIDELGIDYIVADEFFAGSVGLDVDAARAAEVEAFLSDRTELVTEITDPYYGHPSDRSGSPFTTRIYRVLPQP
jgi:4-amino-4-deoxy-L-arabinose transferase-like glycosyltransferase